MSEEERMQQKTWIEINSRFFGFGRDHFEHFLQQYIQEETVQNPTDWFTLFWEKQSPRALISKDSFAFLAGETSSLGIDSRRRWRTAANSTSILIQGRGCDSTSWELSSASCCRSPSIGRLALISQHTKHHCKHLGLARLLRRQLWLKFFSVSCFSWKSHFNLRYFQTEFMNPY